MHIKTFSGGTRLNIYIFFLFLFCYSIVFFFLFEHANSKTWWFLFISISGSDNHGIWCSKQTTFLVLVKTRILLISKLVCYEGLMGSDVYMKDQRSELSLNIEWWMFCIVSLSLIKSTKLLTCSSLFPLLFTCVL